MIAEPPAKEGPPPFETRVLAALERIRPRLKRVLAVFRMRSEDAQDLVQNLAVLALTRGQEAENLEAWLMGATWNLCRMRRRSMQHREAPPLDSIPEPLAPLDEDERIARIDFERSLALLSPGRRKLLRLVVAGHRRRDIAAWTGYTGPGLRKRIARDVSFLASRNLPPRAAPTVPTRGIR